MSTTFTGLPAAVGIDATADWLGIDRTSAGATQKINRNTYLGITGAPVGTTDSQALTNKTIGNTNTITIKDGSFTMQNTASTTKQAIFSLTSITAGQTRTLTVPDASLTIVGTATTQTLTNKTLTAPVINNGSITGTTITTDAIVGQSAGTSGTIYGLSISASKVGTNGVITASITDLAVTAPKVATGFVVQVVSTNFAAVATGATTIPIDDTIPQITEGVEFMTQAITPKSATNILVIEAVGFYACTVATSNTQALFQDATANALAATGVLQPTVNALVMIPTSYSMTAGTTSPTTFRIRTGPSSAATTTFNGSAAARLYGAITKSFIKITEYKA